MRRISHVQSGGRGQVGNRGMRSRFTGWWLGLCASVVLAGLVGCGSNMDSILAQAGSAAGNTALDLLLTDFMNQAADAFDQNAPQPVGDDADDDGDDGDAPAGSPGEQAYAAAGCGACHGAAGEGGSAPALTGVDQTDALNARFADGAVHLGTTLTEQEIADVAAWLLGDEADGGGDDGRAALDGAALYADDCSACHGADGASGFAPDATGLSETDVAAGLGSGSHAAISLSEEEISAITMFLGS